MVRRWAAGGRGGRGARWRRRRRPPEQPVCVCRCAPAKLCQRPQRAQHNRSPDAWRAVWRGTLKFGHPRRGRAGQRRAHCHSRHAQQPRARSRAAGSGPAGARVGDQHEAGWAVDGRQGVCHWHVHAIQEATPESCGRARAALQAGQVAAGRAGSQECADARLLRTFTVVFKCISEVTCQRCLHPGVSSSVTGFPFTFAPIHV